MGFQYGVTYNLKFDDPTMEGFECVMREPSVDEILDVTEVLFGETEKDARAKVQRRTELMAGHITSWNLEDKQKRPLPVSAASINTQGRGFSVQLTAAWLREVIGLTIPPRQSSEPSGDGTDSALTALPMEPAGEPEPSA